MDSRRTFHSPIPRPRLFMWLTWICTLAALILSITNAGMSSLTWSMLATLMIVTVALYYAPAE